MVHLTLSLFRLPWCWRREQTLGFLVGGIYFLFVFPLVCFVLYSDESCGGECFFCCSGRQGCMTKRIRMCSRRTTDSNSNSKAKRRSAQRERERKRDSKRIEHSGAKGAFSTATAAMSSLFCLALLTMVIGLWDYRTRHAMLKVCVIVVHYVFVR